MLLLSVIAGTDAPFSDDEVERILIAARWSHAFWRL
jgi:hypothetical protein